MSELDRDFQNGFEIYKDRLSAISTFKGLTNTSTRRVALHHYEDLGETLEENDEQ